MESPSLRLKLEIRNDGDGFGEVVRRAVPVSLRRHYPDQVQRVVALPANGSRAGDISAS